MSRLAASAAIAAVVLATGCTSSGHTEADGHTDHQHGSVSAQVGGFDDADVTFATMMIPHHQQAVELSALVPDRSSNPDVVKLAAEISAAQAPEIETMKGFLAQWNAGGSGHGGHDMSSMQGMVDDATMAKLKTLKGQEFNTLWLQSMIGHHEGAIDMARAEIDGGTNPDAKTLAQQIVTAQDAEITRMKKMLGG